MKAFLPAQAGRERQAADQRRMQARLLVKAGKDKAEEGPSVRAVQMRVRLACPVLALGKAGGPTRAFSGRRVAPSEIGAILTAASGSTAFPIYRCAAAEAQTVGPCLNSI